MRDRVDSTKASSEPIRIGNGSTMLAAPASQHPWIVVTSARLVGPRIATWSPGTMPACLERRGDGASVGVDLGPRHEPVALGWSGGVADEPHAGRSARRPLPGVR